MADREFTASGKPEWDPERALDIAAADDGETDLPRGYAELRGATAPAPARWYGQRLPVLWTMFMAAREADARALTIWMAETARLLADLPFDIVAHAIDEAIRSARHGFMPTVGEIRAVADPLALTRRRHLARMGEMIDALADPAATAQRTERRRIVALQRNAADRARA